MGLCLPKARGPVPLGLYTKHEIIRAKMGRNPDGLAKLRQARNDVDAVVILVEVPLNVPPVWMFFGPAPSLVVGRCHVLGDVFLAKGVERLCENGRDRWDDHADGREANRGVAVGRPPHGIDMLIDNMLVERPPIGSRFFLQLLNAGADMVGRSPVLSKDGPDRVELGIPIDRSHETVQVVAIIEQVFEARLETFWVGRHQSLQAEISVLMAAIP